MTAIDAVDAPSRGHIPKIPPSPLSDLSVPRFFGREGEFFGLLARGALLLMVTLGIYRFWLTTDIRRYLWGHVEVGQDGLEYTGTARELLIGFLMAIVLLIPINILLFLGTLTPALLPFIGAIGFILLALLGQFAVYRARRYRLTRTIYRGVRFFQTGSAWRYSLRSNLWTVFIVLTAGLAYPWATANLERYKLRHTHFGDLTGRFVGSGTRLFVRGFILWLVVVGPLIAGLFAAIVAIDWATIAAAASGPEADFLKLLAGDTLIAGGLALLAGGGTWALIAGIVLYPLFRAIVLRWWISGLRMGGVAAQSRLRGGQVYAIYGRFLWFAFLFGLVASVGGGLLFGLYVVSVRDLGLSAEVAEISGVLFGLVGYVATMLGYSALYQATVTFRFWRLSFEMTELSGLAALDGVTARGGPSSAFGEGLADALDVGGL